MYSHYTLLLMSKLPHEIISEIRKILRKKTELDRVPHHFGTDILFYNAEIHLIETIGKYPHSSLTFLAGKLKQTKGAVSQTLKRLSSKSCVVKEIDPSNKSSLLITLSPKGVEILKAHQEWHNVQDSIFQYYLDTLDDNNRKVISDFLEQMSHFLEQ